MTTFVEETSGIVALTSTCAIEILVQTQDLTHIHKALLESHGHHKAIQFRPQMPLPLSLLVVFVLSVHILRAPGTRSGVLHRGSTSDAIEVRGIRDGHFVYLGPARKFVESREGITDVGTRHGTLAQPGALGWAIDDTAADAGVVAHGALGSVRVSGAHGEAAVSIAEVGWITPGDVAARTAVPEGGAAVVWIPYSVHHSCGSRSGGCEDVAVGDFW